MSPEVDSVGIALLSLYPRGIVALSCDEGVFVESLKCIMLLTSTLDMHLPLNSSVLVCFPRLHSFT